MTAVFFLYGLAFFSLGLVVALEARRTSALALSRHLPWLAAFGLTHGLVEWCDMFLLIGTPASLHAALELTRTLLLPASAVLLVRFGVGLISEAGPLPDWLLLLPVALIVPAALLAAYALIVAITEPPLTTAADVWSRYLLYFPGCLLAAFGFGRQAARLPQAGLAQARPLLLGAAAAFAANAAVGGLIVPRAAYGLAAWLNYDATLALTHVPVQVWRALSALAVTLLVIRAMGVFEAERQQHLDRLHAERERIQQAALQAQWEARRVAEEWTEGLVSLSRRIAALEDVDQVLMAVVDLARSLLRGDSAAIALWNADQTRLEVKWMATAQGLQPAANRSVDNTVILQVVQEGRPRRYPDDLPALNGGWRCPVLQADLAAVAIVPLLLDHRPIGGLWVGRLTSEAFTSNQLIGLGHLADQAVIAIQHGLMAANLQSLAVLEERGRLAHEMHDGLAQVLGYLSLQTQTVEALVRRGDRDAALAELKQARGHILEAQADVRENILSLRTTLAGTVGLVTALQQYASEFEIQTGIRAEVVCTPEAEPRLSPLAEVQLVRVIQEALTNVRKHASARCVQVRVTTCDHTLEVQVVDDGCGFEPPVSQAGHFGLQTMHERIESVGGALRIETQPGSGTRVQLSVPMI